MRSNEQIATELGTSPLFNLSLASKELFHSNFIDWLCKTYQYEMGNIFSKYVQDGKKIVKSEREARKSDIRVTFDSNEVLIIENKVKSIPNESQLRVLKDRFQDSSLLLLTMTQPSFGVNEWKALLYDKFLDQLRSQFLIDSFKTKNSYHFSLIEDYVRFVNLLFEGFNQFNDFRKINFEEFQSRLGPYRNIRMYDMILKRTYANIGFEIKKKIEMEFESGKLFFNQKSKDKQQPGMCHVVTDMSNGKGLVYIYMFVVSNEQSIFVGLDENRIEVGTSGKDPETNSQYFNEVKTKLYGQIPIEKLDFIKGRKSKKIYGKFHDGCSWYRWREVNENVTIGKTIDEVCKLIKLIKSQFNVQS